jgi:hypothetical protein
LYQNAVLADSGVISGAGTLNGEGAGSSPQVVIRVITPDTGTAWRWSATVEYSV